LPHTRNRGEAGYCGPTVTASRKSSEHAGGGTTRSPTFRAPAGDRGGRTGCDGASRLNRRQPLSPSGAVLCSDFRLVILFWASGRPVSAVRVGYPCETPIRILVSCPLFAERE
jgi:hypothetical protein